MSTVVFPDVYTCNAVKMCGLINVFMLYSRHLAYRHQPSTLNTFSISEEKFSTFSITLWLSTQSVTYNSYVKSLYCLWLA